MKICPKCGFENEGEAQFCGKCAASLVLTEEVPQTVQRYALYKMFRREDGKYNLRKICTFLLGLALLLFSVACLVSGNHFLFRSDTYIRHHAIGAAHFGLLGCLLMADALSALVKHIYLVLFILAVTLIEIGWMAIG